MADPLKEPIGIEEELVLEEVMGEMEEVEVEVEVEIEEVVVEVEVQEEEDESVVEETEREGSVKGRGEVGDGGA
jgi:hypothetical protein